MHTTHHATHVRHAAAHRLPPPPAVLTMGRAVGGWLKAMRRAWERQNRREARLIDLYWRTSRRGGGPFPPWGMFPGA